MGKAPRGGNEHPKQDAEAAELRRRRNVLGAGLDSALRRHAPEPENSRRGSALGMAFRIATELVAGLIVGGGMGWLLDAWLGTRPFLFLAFFALGAAAGMINVFRYAYRMNRQADRSDGEGRPPEAGDRT